jgi:hypothetical protein
VAFCPTAGARRGTLANRRSQADHFDRKLNGATNGASGSEDVETAEIPQHDNYSILTVLPIPPIDSDNRRGEIY